MHHHANLRPSDRRRRGSALIIVLGILSVLMLMAVAFSTFVRTERGGTTNLKNAFVARSSLFSALGRAMEAIDLSFGSATNDDPVAAWPCAWLASAEGGDKFQSAELGGGETAGAHVLTPEMAEYLSPAQLALVKSAKCNWSPIFSSISASPASTGYGGGVYGDYGRPSEDSLVGRYAFVALETTGLLDLNYSGGGTPEERAATSGSDTLAFRIPSGIAKDSDGIQIPRFVQNPALFVSSRNYFSLADARNRVSGAFDSTVPSAEEDYYPADLFAGFAPSLSELDPEGRPKIQLPTRANLGTYSAKDYTALVRRVFRAMVGIFARGRVAAGRDATAVLEDSFPIFQNAGINFRLSRSALATVALLDGLDLDSIPGQSVNPAAPYWSYLPDVTISVKNTGGGTATVTEKKPDFNGYANPLNYPCTESAALLSSVFAYVEIDPTPHDNTTGDVSTWTRTYNGTLHVGARAVCQNKTSKTSSHSADVNLQWEVMQGAPTSGTVAGGDSKDIREGKIEMGSGPDDFGNGGESQISWVNFFRSGSKSSGSFNLEDSGDGSRVVGVEDTADFTIVCGWNDLVGDWYRPTKAEEDGFQGDVFVPIRMKVTITGDKGTIQQVPAPAIDSKSWWLRVDAGVYHGDQTEFTEGKKTDGSFGDLAVGWACCPVPTFGFDTTCLATVDGDRPKESTMKFWLNDICARNGGVDDFGNAGGEYAEILDEFYYATDAKAAAIGEFGFDDFSSVSGRFWNYLQTSWLFNPEEEYSHVTQWMNTSAGAHMPDMLHCVKNNSRGGRPFAEVNGRIGTERLGGELYSRIPAEGYETVADLGTVMCGPYETLSLYKTWRFGSDRADFHPVLDYFSVDEDRYPKKNDITGKVNGEGDVDWAALGGTTGSWKDLYSAAHNGRVNLNAPPLVEASKVSNGKAVRGVASDFLNPYPIASVLNGAPYSGTVGTGKLGEDVALQLAEDFCEMLRTASSPEMKIKSERWPSSSRNVVKNLSFLGMGGPDENKFLNHFLTKASPAPQCDYDREGLFRGMIDGFTARGQSYLVVIRADAYSPKFGENDSVQDGTTLATTHAIVELFRDPLPARAPDGSFPSDGEGPVAYHNWYVRSFRVF